ncbi:MAG: DsbE family thiol:disulfide interchange protein [Methylobacteriaceae bacterium]|nr:DsbE family thiol:disulfide interchange protein [Methylobacteriaceae bacterium]
MLLLLPVAVFVGLAALFALRLGAGDPSRLPSALIGKAAPSLDLPPLAGLKTPAGEPVPGLAAAELRDGRVTVLNVWASWCGPCQLEHPFLLELARAPGLRLVGINYKDGEANARRFLGALGNPYAAVGVDGSGRAAIEWGVYGVPETFVIGPDGRVRHRQVEPITAATLGPLLEQVRQAAAP